MHKCDHLQISCREVKRHILDNLDTQIRFPQFRRYKRHLDRCTECQSYLADVKSVIWSYRHYPYLMALIRLPSHPPGGQFPELSQQRGRSRMRWERSQTI
jgi:hypothetical protein